jgi:hypothetical protein
LKLAAHAWTLRSRRSAKQKEHSFKIMWIIVWKPPSNRWIGRSGRLLKSLRKSRSISEAGECHRLQSYCSRAPPTPGYSPPSAIVLGALHGLEPGHSKTMMAAFIAAIRGTVWQAVMLGIAATISHTAVAQGLWLSQLGRLRTPVLAEETSAAIQSPAAGLVPRSVW